MTNSPLLDSELLSASWDSDEPTTKEVIEEAKFWDEIGWGRIVSPENQNMDLMPNQFSIDFQCSECGSAWGRLLAVGFIAPKIRGGVSRWNGAHLEVLPDFEPLVFRAARIECLDGHAFDHDFFTGRSRKKETPTWFNLAIGGMAVIASFAAAYGLFRGK